MMSCSALAALCSYCLNRLNSNVILLQVLPTFAWVKWSLIMRANLPKITILVYSALAVLQSFEAAAITVRFPSNNALMEADVFTCFQKLPLVLFQLFYNTTACKKLVGKPFLNRCRQRCALWQVILTLSGMLSVMWLQSSSPFFPCGIAVLTGHGSSRDGSGNPHSGPRRVAPYCALPFLIHGDPCPVKIPAFNCENVRTLPQNEGNARSYDGGYNASNNVLDITASQVHFLMICSTHDGTAGCHWARKGFHDALGALHWMQWKRKLKCRGWVQW